MKTKHALAVLFLGFALTIIGAWAKITHQLWANFMMTLSTAVEVIGVLLLVYKLITHPKLKDFLNQ